LVSFKSYPYSWSTINWEHKSVRTEETHHFFDLPYIIDDAVDQRKLDFTHQCMIHFGGLSSALPSGGIRTSISPGICAVMMRFTGLFCRE
ncbi:hypothetical protein ACFL6S_34595, partial [Candidatus Poribacteria bacterium]